MQPETIAQAFGADTPVRAGQGYSRAELLTQAYRYHRQRGAGTRRPVESHGLGNPEPVAGGAAAECLRLARADADAGRIRFPLPRIGRGCTAGYQPRFEAWGESHMRWVEQPEAAGLRFVGYADELARLDHTGWYLDGDGAGETVRGVVYQLPTRAEGYVYAYGYSDPFNDGPACLSFANDADCSVQAAIWADHVAERMAESEREYREASSAGLRYVDAADTIREARDRARRLIREIRHARRVLGAAEFPATCEELRQSIRKALRDVREAREEREELRDTYGAHDGFRDVVSEEGAA